MYFGSLIKFPLFDRTLGKKVPIHWRLADFQGLKDLLWFLKGDCCEIYSVHFPKKQFVVFLHILTTFLVESFKY